MTVKCGIAMAQAVAFLSPMKRNRMGCVITDRGNNVISSGYNLMKTHPTQSHYANKAGLKEKIYLHAEINAIIRLKNSSIKPSKLYVTRLLVNNSLAMSYPCPVCLGAIVE